MSMINPNAQFKQERPAPRQTQSVAAHDATLEQERAERRRSAGEVAGYVIRHEPGAVLFTLQTAAAGYLGARYVVIPSKKLGARADEYFYEVGGILDGAKQFFATVTGQHTTQAASLEATLAEIEARSARELTASGAAKNAQVQARSRLITEYRTAYAQYEGVRASLPNQLLDAEKTMQQIYGTVGQVGEMLKPKIIDPFMAAKEWMLQKLGGKGGAGQESYTQYYDRLQADYKQLGDLGAAANRALTSLAGQRAEALTQKSVDQLASDNAYLEKSIEVMQLYTQLPKLKQMVAEANPSAKTAEQFQHLQSDITQIESGTATLAQQFHATGVQGSDMRHYGADYLPLATAMLLALGYTQLVKYEKRIVSAPGRFMDWMHKAADRLHNVFYTSDAPKEK